MIATEAVHSTECQQGKRYDAQTRNPLRRSVDSDAVIVSQELAAGLHKPAAVLELSSLLCPFFSGGCETRVRKLNFRLWRIAFGLCGDVRRNCKEKRILLGVVER